MNHTRSTKMDFLKLISLGMGAYQLLYTQVLLQDTEGHLLTHLGWAIVVVTLSLVTTIDHKSGKCGICM